jgi:protein required for attachment to host cells
VAAPGFLGDLRNNLTPQTERLVELEIAKDLVGLSIRDLRDHLPDELFE